MYLILDEINIATEEIHVNAIGNEDTVDFIEMQQADGKPYTIDEFKPYLRQLGSMTDEELYEWTHTWIMDTTAEKYDWLNAHHFDYRGLIEKGLALQAPEGMYKISNSTIGNE